jgi:hypothetical protein
MAADTWLDTTEKLSRILSSAAIPVVIAVFGWLIQRKLQHQTLRRDYVQLALSILQNPDPSKVDPTIREWAVDLLDKNSPTKLKPEAIKKLKSGEITLSGFSFVPSSALTPELQQKLEASLEKFKAYLVKLGFGGFSETISVKISPGTVVDDEGFALWDPTTHTIMVANAFATDEVSVLRQFAHALLFPSGKPSDDYCAIESGLATYFPCSFTDHPILGDKASAAGKAMSSPQDLRKRRKFEEIRVSEWKSVQNDGSEVWGGALWEIRQLLGAEVADRMIANTWQAFSHASEEDAYASFGNSLLANSRSIEGGRYTEQLREIFKGRGLRLTPSTTGSARSAGPSSRLVR